MTEYEGHFPEIFRPPLHEFDERLFKIDSVASMAPAVIEQAVGLDAWVRSQEAELSGVIYHSRYFVDAGPRAVLPSAREAILRVLGGIDEAEDFALITLRTSQLEDVVRDTEVLTMLEEDKFLVGNHDAAIPIAEITPYTFPKSLNKFPHFDAHNTDLEAGWLPGTEEQWQRMGHIMREGIK